MSTPTSNSVTAIAVSLSPDQFLSSVLAGTKWGSFLGTGVSLTYSFPVVPNYWDPNYSTLNEPFTIGGRILTSTEAYYARMALDVWSHYANLTFSEVSDNQISVGDIRFGWTDSVLFIAEAAHAYTPGNVPRAGDVWLNINATASFSAGLAPGTYGYLVLLHETGHTLGLKHPFETSDQNTTILDNQYDDLINTVMSYNAVPGKLNSQYSLSYHPTTPMELDIRAIQYFYGEIGGSIRAMTPMYSIRVRTIFRRYTTRAETTRSPGMRPIRAPQSISIHPPVVASAIR
jgi:serralysin